MEGNREMSPEELLILDEWLGDVKGMALALLVKSAWTGGDTDVGAIVATARFLVESVNEEISNIAEATLAERGRSLESLDREADPQPTG